MTRKEFYAGLIGADAMGATFAAIVGFGGALAIFLLAGGFALACYSLEGK